jgi:hypothetical protein
MPLDLLERIDCIMTPNTRPELQLEAGARHERTLFPVRSRPLILIDAPSSTSPRGMLGGDKGHSGEEETSGASPPSNTHFTAGSTCLPAPCPSASCPRRGRAWGTGTGRLAPHRCSKPWHPPGPSWASVSHAS